MTIENQFGVQEIVVTAPRLLAVPTQKAPELPPVAISHFTCYEAGGPALHEPVTLRDQFHVEEARVLQPRSAEKTVEEAVTPSRMRPI